MGGHGVRAVGLILVLVAALTSGGARAALPARIATEIERTAREVQALVQNDAALAGALNNAELATILVRRAHQRAAESMSAAVIGAIAQSPAHAAEIVAVASAIAPQYRDRIVFDAARAFPGFVGALPAAGGQYAAPVYAVQPVYAHAAPVHAHAAPVPAIADTGGGPIEAIDDPFESFNRGVFFVNDQLDTFLIRPIAWTYGFITPDLVKDAIGRAFLNLRAPARFANDLLQGEVGDAGTTGARFLVNSSIGVAGLFDVAAALGHHHHPSDFGQTLHAYGAGAGPYLVIPVLGPSTVRDGMGRVVDVFFDPFTYLLDTVPEGLSLAAGEGIVRREGLIEVLDDVKAGSVDYYAGVRSLYYQDRAVELRRGRPADTSTLDDEFGAFE